MDSIAHNWPFLTCLWPYLGDGLLLDLVGGDLLDLLAVVVEAPRGDDLLAVADVLLRGRRQGADSTLDFDHDLILDHFKDHTGARVEEFIGYNIKRYSVFLYLYLVLDTFSGIIIK